MATEEALSEIEDTIKSFELRQEMKNLRRWLGQRHGLTPEIKEQKAPKGVQVCYELKGKKLLQHYVGGQERGARCYLYGAQPGEKEELESALNERRESAPRQTVVWPKNKGRLSMLARSRSQFEVLRIFLDRFISRR